MMIPDMLVCIGYVDESNPDLARVFSVFVEFVEGAPECIKYAAANGNEGSRVCRVQIQMINKLSEKVVA